MKQQTKLAAIAAALTLTCTALAPAVSADTLEQLTLEVSRLRPAQYVMPLTVEELDAFPLYQCYVSNDGDFEGIAVTCADVEALKNGTLAGYPIVWSEGMWSSYWEGENITQNIKYDTTHFLLQPLEGLVAEYGDYAKYEGAYWGYGPDAVDLSEHRLSDSVQSDEPIYVLSSYKSDIPKLLHAVLCDAQVEVLGFTLGSMERLGYLDSDRSVFVYPKAGMELTAEDFGEYASAASPLKDCWEVNVQSYHGTALKPVLQALQSMPQVDHIDFDGGCEEYADAIAENERRCIDIIPIQADLENAYVYGDLDMDGKIDTHDAISTLNAYVQSDVIGAKTDAANVLNERERAAADVNQDGSVNADDAVLILRYYVNETVLGSTVAWETLAETAVAADA